MTRNNLLGWVLAAAAFSSSMPALADLKLGIFPRRPVAQTVQAYTPLAEKLTQALGETVEIVVPKDFPSFVEALKNKQFDIAHMNQYHYYLASKTSSYKVFAANEEGGERTIAGAIIVRADANINSLSDLKGKTILFAGDNTAMGSYIGPTAALKKAGLKPGIDYKEEFAKNPPSALMGTFSGNAAAAGTGNRVLGMTEVKEKIDVSQLKILAESEAIVQLPWAVKADLPADKAQKIQQAMTSLKGTPEGQAILKSAGATDFFAVTDADFGKVVEVIKYAIGE